MRTDPTHAAAIEDSLTLAGERAGDLTPQVYALLFARHPEMEILFWRDTDGSIRGEMLMRVFEALLDFIGDRKYADHMIQGEVVTHEGYDVPRNVFCTFFRILAEAIEQACGDGWTEPMAAAWRVTLDELDTYVAGPQYAQA